MTIPTPTPERKFRDFLIERIDTHKAQSATLEVDLFSAQMDDLITLTAQNAAYRECVEIIEKFLEIYEGSSPCTKTN